MLKPASLLRSPQSRDEGAELLHLSLDFSPSKLQHSRDGELCVLLGASPLQHGHVQPSHDLVVVAEMFYEPLLLDQIHDLFVSLDGRLEVAGRDELDDLVPDAG